MFIPSKTGRFCSEFKPTYNLLWFSGPRNVCVAGRRNTALRRDLPHAAQKKKVTHVK
jgi:hypothetical protein